MTGVKEKKEEKHMKKRLLSALLCVCVSVCMYVYCVCTVSLGDWRRGREREALGLIPLPSREVAPLRDMVRGGM